MADLLRKGKQVVMTFAPQHVGTLVEDQPGHTLMDFFNVDWGNGVIASTRECEVTSKQVYDQFHPQKVNP